jgi:hypothetical protein
MHKRLISHEDMQHPKKKEEVQCNFSQFSSPKRKNESKNYVKMFFHHSSAREKTKTRESFQEGWKMLWAPLCHIENVADDGNRAFHFNKCYQYVALYKNEQVENVFQF